jgi:photosystem II stability/assembly factor-like uncharacterized protein
VENTLAQKPNQLAAGGRLNPPVINQRKGNIMDKLTIHRRLPTILLPITLILLAIGSYSSTAANPVTPDSRSSVASSSFVWQKVNVGLEAPFAIQFSSNYGVNGQVYAFRDYTTLVDPLGQGYGAIFRSNTRGSTWDIYSGVPPLLLLAAVSPETASGPVILALERYYEDGEAEYSYRLVRSTSQASGWTTVWSKSPLFTQIVFSPAFATDGTVFVVYADSPNGGIWKSTDGGITWHPDQKIVVHPSNGRVLSLAFSPNFSVDHTLMASVPSYWDGEVTWPGDTMRSENGGNTWTISDSFTSCLGRVWKLAFSPNFAVDQTVFAMGDDSSDLDNYRIYRSTDKGKNWICMPNQPQAGTILDIALSPAFASDHTILLGTKADGLVQSMDGGTSWHSLAWDGSAVQYAVFSPNYPADHALAAALLGGEPGGPGGTFFSYNNGSSWQPAGIYPAPVLSMALSPSFDSDPSLWASLGSGQGSNYRSNNSGKTWLGQPPYNMQGRIAFLDLAAGPKSTGGYMVFGTSQLGAGMGGVYSSADSGATYFRFGGPAYASEVVVSPAFASDQTVWAGSFDGLYYSTNSGTAWGLLPGDLPAESVIGLAVSPAYPTDHTLFAVVSDTSSTQLYRTTNSGTNWSVLTLPVGAVPSKVAISPAYATDQTIWVSTVGSGVLRSSNKGDTWLSPTTVLSNCGKVQPNGTSSGRLLWAVCGVNLYRSSDEGATWIQDGPAGANASVVAAFPDNKSVFLGTSNKGIYRRILVYNYFLPFARK